ncbi:diaminopimelate epimerase [Methanobrevibacter cuticularis]|uniref:Diaminopimelate epimerase n=1 Tax=Methanobrevibacter cuticularis TaxID=47311 RepID=A0A166DT12_9EURY|nr:diaminopimelate epimerase [Methanobrevibacter cuticularis]KZX15922.1 diaminopimelate epimerase [Methanobrevibacter cuticularis]
MNLEGLKFSKMHGLGNDYVVIDESKEELIAENEKTDFSIEVCTKGFSIGADGVIFITPSSGEGEEKGDIRFRIFNADGSEAEMCGNGIRCFSKFIYDYNIIKKDIIKVETLGGIKTVEITAENGLSKLFRVDMGLSTFKTKNIPMIAEVDEFLEKDLIVNGEAIAMTTVNVGNPHAVIFTENTEDIDLDNYGPAIENHEAFPERINVHFVEIISKNEIVMLTWERGAGYTHACGTGATSCVLAGNKLGVLDNKVLVHLPGGDLEIEVYEKENELGAFMKGDAKLVFNGEMI